MLTNDVTKLSIWFNILLTVDMRPYEYTKIPRSDLDTWMSQMHSEERIVLSINVKTTLICG